jgi:hypothetical protein
MGVVYGTNLNLLVQSGLVLNLDAANPKSYPGSGTTWTDLSGNGNNGTLTNGATYSSANGGSIVFDGTDDIVNTSYVSSNAFTWSVWFKTDVGPVPGTFRNIISIPSPNYILLLLDQSSPNLGFWTSDGLNGGFLSTPTISVNTWYNAVFVREGNNITNGYKTYVNSVSYGTANTGTWSTTDTLSFGGRTDTTQFLDGNIAQVSIYNRALTASEVQQNFNILRGRFGI